MKRHLLKVFLLSAMIATSGMMFTSCKDYDDDIDDLNNKIENLQTGKLASLEEQLNSLKTTASSLEQADQALKTQIDKQVSDLSDAKGEIDQLRTDLSGDIASLESSLQEAKEDLQGKIDELTQSQNDATDEIEKLKGELSSLQGAKEDLQGKINELTQSLGGATDEIEKLKGDLAGAAKKEDIESLQEKNNKLEKDIETLKSSLSALTTKTEAIENLQGRLAKVEEYQKSLQTLADAAAAKKELENSITSLRSYCDETFLTNATADTTYAKLADVADAVALVKNLGMYTTETAITTAIDNAVAAAVSANGEAFKAAFETRFNAAFDAAFGEALERELATEARSDGKITAAIKQAIAEYDVTMKASLQAALEKEHGEITKEISEAITKAQGTLEGKLDELKKELKKWVSGRLTSVLLIPDYYVNGIEAIKLKSLSYKAWTVTSTDKKEELKQGTKVSTTAISTTDVRYNLSPTIVTEDDIKEPSFIFEKAEVSTRAAVSDQLLTVEGKKIANGVLTVTVKKASGVSLTLDDSHIYTAALKVPLADKYINEGEGGSAVYSDYAMLDETTVEPKIAALIDKNSTKKTDKFECNDETTKHFHFSANYEAAKTASPSITQAYNKTIDLLSMVTGCYVENGTAKELSKKALEEAGLEFRFAVPTLAYKLGENNADQQEFAKVDEDGKTLSSKLPDGTLNNKAAIDKTPIVRVELVDVNNNNAVVDVCYFKIQWVKENISSVDLGTLKTFDYTLTCNAFKGKLTWEEMVNKVLGQLGENGMSQDEFVATYGIPEISAEDHTAGTVATADADPVEFVYNYDNDADESAAAFTWKLTTKQIGKVMNTDNTQTVFSKKVNVTIPATNKYQGELTFSFVVNIKLPTLPEINGYDASFWHTDYSLAYVYPVQYKTPGATGTCEYKYDLDRLFADSRVLKKMLKCGKWDLKFAAEQPEFNDYFTDFRSTEEEPGVSAETGLVGNDNIGYTLKWYDLDKHNYMTAVKLNFNTSMGSNWYAPETQNNDAVNVSKKADITLELINNTGGKNLVNVQNGEPYKEAALKVWAAINPYNFYEVTKFNVAFVPPLKINTEVKDQHFVDQVISGSEVNKPQAFTMTDFKDYTVAKKTTNKTDEKKKYAEELYTYYGVNEPNWDLENAKTNLKKDGDGNYVVDETMTADEATIPAKDRFGEGCFEQSEEKITFKNISGVKVEKTVKIFIPVTVTHKWGEMTEYVTIELWPEAKK